MHYFNLTHSIEPHHHSEDELRIKLAYHHADTDPRNREGPWYGPYLAFFATELQAIVIGDQSTLVPILFPQYPLTVQINKSESVHTDSEDDDDNDDFEVPSSDSLNITSDSMLQEAFARVRHIRPYPAPSSPLPPSSPPEGLSISPDLGDPLDLLNIPSSPPLEPRHPLVQIPSPDPPCPPNNSAPPEPARTKNSLGARSTRIPDIVRLLFKLCGRNCRSIVDLVIEIKKSADLVLEAENLHFDAKYAEIQDQVFVQIGHIFGHCAEVDTVGYVLARGGQWIYQEQSRIDSLRATSRLSRAREDSAEYQLPNASSSNNEPRAFEDELMDGKDDKLKKFFAGKKMVDITDPRCSWILGLIRERLRTLNPKFWEDTNDFQGNNFEEEETNDDQDQDPMGDSEWTGPPYPADDEDVEMWDSEEDESDNEI